jgi:hypothetical protein
MEQKNHQRLSLIGTENLVVYSPHNSRRIARRRIAGQLSVSGPFWNNWGGSREENAERIYCFLFDADGSTGTIFRGLEGPNAAAVCRCIADPFNLHNSLKMRKTRGHCELTIGAHLILSQPLVDGAFATFAAYPTQRRVRRDESREGRTYGKGGIYAFVELMVGARGFDRWISVSEGYNSETRQAQGVNGMRSWLVPWGKA